MASFQDYLDFLISGVRVRNPSIDTSPGSPVRVLLDPTAEMAAQADLATASANDWNIDNFYSDDLDNFCSVLGFTRIPATHAVGNVTISFAANTTRDYVIPEGTSLHSNRGNIIYTYQTTTAIGVPRYSSYAVLPIIAQNPGSEYNAREGDVRSLDFNIEQLILTINEKPIIGGKAPESDEDFRNRFRSDLFRNRLGSEAWYRSLADRNTSVSSSQLITPAQETEEYLIVKDKTVKCQEDSLKYTYPNSFGVYSNKDDLWLEENINYLVVVDNESPLPPRIEFLDNSVADGDNVMVRYRYNSTRSRNNPKNNVLSYLDLFVLGTSPSPVIDYSIWPSQNIFGFGSITDITHPEGILGKPYYIFVRQPVVEAPKEINVGGRYYLLNKDYKFIKDKGPNANSTRARDILLWLTTLPTSQRYPGFNVSYFHESVVSDIQEVANLPDMHSAVDDLLVHSADKISFDVNINIEWDKGIRDEETVRNTIQDYFSTVPMGSKIRIGSLIRTISQISSVASIFLKEPGITSEIKIRGRREWNFDVPLPDGTVPLLNNLYITNTASNTL